MKEENILIAKDLNFSYSKSEKIIDNLSLNIPKNSIYGFLGPNGSGKTTTIRILLGLLKTASGNVEIFGKDIKFDRINALNNVGALIETPSLYEHLTAYENLKLVSIYKNNFDFKEIEELLDVVNLIAVKNKKVQTFSLGMKQRLSIAIALLNKPRLIILDEPTNGLDPQGIIEIRSLIKNLNQKYNTGFLISSHLLHEIEKICTHIGIIQKGKLLYEGSLANFKSSFFKEIHIIAEIDNPTLAKELLELKQIQVNTITDDSISFKLNDKKQVPEIMSYLKFKDILVYQFKFKEDLEELFINLTKNHN